MLTEKESLGEKFIRKGFWLYLFAFLMGPLGYIIKVLISRDLSIEEVGIIYGVISFVGLLSTYNDLGFTESMSYYLPKYIVKHDYARAKYILRLVLSSQIISSIVIYVGLFILAPWLSENYFKSEITEILQIAGLFFIGANLIHFSKGIFSSVQDTKLQNGSEFVRLTMTALGVIILFFSDEGTTKNYMIAWIIGLFIGVLFSVFWAIKKYYTPYFKDVKTYKDTALRKSFFLYSLSTLFAGNISTLLSQIDMQLIIYYLTPSDVGYYSAYLSIIGIPFIFFSPIIGFLLPVISELSGRGNDKKIQFLAERFWSYFIIMGTWTSLFLFLFGENLTILLFGEKFRFSGEILQYSAPFLVFNLLGQISLQILSGRGEIRKRIHVLMIVLIINIVLNVILIKALGVKGSALAVGLSWIPLFFLALKGTKIKLLLEKKKHLTNTIALLFTYSLSIILQNTLKFHFITEIILAILLYMCIFLLANMGLLREFLVILKKGKGKNYTS